MKKFTKIMIIAFIIKLAIFIIINANNKPVPFGVDLRLKDWSLKYKKGYIKLDKEKLIARYIITGQNIKSSNTDDFIIFLHGVSRSEEQWLDKKGFGSQFYEILRMNPNFDSIPVVSLSFGMSFLIVDNVPYPFDSNLEQIFINKIIPYLQKKLNRYGNIYIIGHSMGGYSAISLSLKYNEKFPIVLAISPFISPYSPFTDDFLMKNDELSDRKWWSKAVKKMLVYLFANEEQWNKNDPFNLIKNYKKDYKPYIIITKSTKELIGFNHAILRFNHLLEKNNYPHYYYISAGDHHIADIKFPIYRFLKKINQVENDNVIKN